MLKTSVLRPFPSKNGRKSVAYYGRTCSESLYSNYYLSFILLNYYLIFFSFPPLEGEVHRVKKFPNLVRSSISSPEGNEVSYSSSFDLHPLSYYMRTDTTKFKPFTKIIYYIYVVYINPLDWL